MAIHYSTVSDRTDKYRGSFLKMNVKSKDFNHQTPLAEMKIWSITFLYDLTQINCMFTQGKLISKLVKLLQMVMSAVLMPERS